MASDLEQRIDKLAAWMFEAKRLVVFTGAGISTESGIPDFRGPDGLWTRRAKGLPTEWPDLSKGQPNAGHLAIVELQKLGKLNFLISQNVDNLHLKSGIRPELLAELHGNITRVRCNNCEFLMDNMGETACPVCGGTLVSSVVNFGQPMPPEELEKAYSCSRKCDVFLAVGSSLVVYPAADMPKVAFDTGAKLVILNRGETPIDEQAHLRFWEAIGSVLPVAIERLKRLMKV